MQAGSVACVWAPLVSGVDGDRAESCGRSERIGAAVRSRTSPAERLKEVNTRLIPLRGQEVSAFISVLSSSRPAARASVAAQSLTWVRLN